MDDEPLPLATYATVLANLLSHRDQPIESVLSPLGVTAEQLHKADEYYNARLREAHRLRKGALAMMFASAFADARHARGLFGAPAAAAPQLPAPSASVAQSPAVPSYMAAPPAVSTPAVSAPAMSVAAPAIPVPAVSAPAVPAPVVPPPAPPSMLAAPMPAAPPVKKSPSTAEIPIMGGGPSSAVPFRSGPTPDVATPTSRPGDAPVPTGPGTGTLPAAADSPRLPDTPWDQAGSRIGKLSLAHFAAMTVELSRKPADLTPLLRRYGLSSADDIRYVTAAFEAQMQVDPNLRTQFEALVGRMRSMSGKRD